MEDSPLLNCSQGRPSGIEAAFGYAPGQEPFSPPPNVGGPLAASPGGHQSFLIEVHYNNPVLTQGVLDSSGIRFYWTRTLREHQLGAAVMGDPSTALVGTLTGNSTGVYHHSFTCPATCSGAAIQSASTPSLTVIQQYLHMHSTGARIVHTQRRGGEAVHTAAIDYWQFDEQGNALVQDSPYQVEPGDEFLTECWYKTDGNTRFGFASGDEMCAVFMYYYPRVLIGGQVPWFCAHNSGFPTCETDWESDAVDDDADNLGRLFGSADDSRICPQPELTETEAPSTSEPTAAAGLVVFSSFWIMMTCSLFFFVV